MARYNIPFPMQNPRDPTIRHAGRAHIRGRIRRVWRPRYLELCDSGMVRYYELPPTADVTLPEDSDWDHVNMIPKDTLVIFYARIIDVTTLRDLHVGLPRGSFGFLFRGQRVLAQELSPPCHPPEPIQPRDFFCAVSSLEEAQTWVIALQWAASVWKHAPPSAVKSTLNLSSRIGRSPPSLYQGESDSSRRPTTSLVDSAKTNERSTEDRRLKSGRIVVTKVQQCRLVRLHSLQWEIAFEVELLLLQQVREGVERSPAQLIEERRVLKTPQDLQLFLLQLDQEIGGGGNSRIVDLIQKLRAQVLKLPRLSSSKSTMHVKKFSLSRHQLARSFQRVDGILRSLAMDAAIVNSHAMKHCFFLAVEEHALHLNQFQPWSLWLHCHGSSRSGLVYRKVQSLPTLTSTDDFVKKWLSETTSNCNPILDGQLVWFLTRPWSLVGGLGIVIAAVALPLAQLYRIVMVSVRLRLDVLVFTWIVAAVCGRYLLELPRSKPVEISRRRPILSTRNTLRDSKLTSRIRTVEDLSSEASDDSGVDGDLEYLVDEGEVEDTAVVPDGNSLSSPLPLYPANGGESCWSIPGHEIFRVRGISYLEDRVKIPSGPSPFSCRGVDVWLTDNPERHIARHPDVLGGKLMEMDTFLVNFLLPFGNFVSYFSIPPIDEFPSKELASVWTKFLKGDQQYRDARLKMLPVVVDGPWIVKAAVGNGSAPALLGKVIPLQYFFQDPSPSAAGIYEVDVIITASSIAKGILSVVKGHTKSLTIAFAFIIEAAEKDELPESVLCAFQVHALHLEDCPRLPHTNQDETGSVM